MNFETALTALKKGKTVRLSHWSDDVFIKMQSPDAHSMNTHQYLYVSSSKGRVPWINTVPELFSDCWVII